MESKCHSCGAQASLCEWAMCDNCCPCRHKYPAPKKPEPEVRKPRELFGEDLLD